MKKYFIIAAAAVVAMAACSKVETIDNTPAKEIRFSVVNHLQQTKASTTGLVYPTSVPFGTFAWWTEHDWTGVAADQTYVFMDNQEITWHSIEANTPEVWAPTTTYYWTKTGKITFASYSPYTDGTDNGFSAEPVYDITNGFLFTNYTVVDDTDVDLMYANLAANCSQSSNESGTLVYDGTTGENGTDHGYSGVPTIFNHALCQLGFAFRAIGHKNPNVDRIVIDVTDVDIKNIDYKGSFTEKPTTSTDPKWASTHAAANYKDYEYAPDETMHLTLIDNTTANLESTTNYTSLGKTRILLPQTLINSQNALDATTDQVLVVKYTIKTKYTSVTLTDETAAGYWATEDVVSTVRLHNGNIAAWADNQNITYRISINPYTTAITFDPAVVDWDDMVYSDDIEINPNN